MPQLSPEEREVMRVRRRLRRQTRRARARDISRPSLQETFFHVPPPPPGQIYGFDFAYIQAAQHYQQYYNSVAIKATVPDPTRDCTQPLVGPSEPKQGELSLDSINAAYRNIDRRGYYQPWFSNRDNETSYIGDDSLNFS